MKYLLLPLLFIALACAEPAGNPTSPSDTPAPAAAPTGVTFDHMGAVVAATSLDCRNTPGAGGIVQIVSAPPTADMTIGQGSLRLMGDVIRDDPRTAGTQFYCNDTQQRMKWFTNAQPTQWTYTPDPNNVQAAFITPKPGVDFAPVQHAWIAGAWNGSTYISPGIRDTSRIKVYADWCELPC